MPKKTVETEPVNENPVETPAPEPVTDESPKTPLEAFIYHQRRALEETGKALEALLPEGFKEHGSTAGREFIKSFQVLVDAAINEIEKATAAAETIEPDDDQDRPSTTGRTKVKVQVD